jgi:hypothetical protein
MKRNFCISEKQTTDRMLWHMTEQALCPTPDRGLSLRGSTAPQMHWPRTSREVSAERESAGLVLLPQKELSLTVPSTLLSGMVSSGVRV